MTVTERIAVVIITATLSTMILIPISLCCGLAAWTFCPRIPEQRTFVADEWRSGGVDACRAMVVDCVTRFLPGKSRDELEESLGTSLFWSEPSRDLMYHIGYSEYGIFAGEEEYLVIRINDNDKFESWHVDGPTPWDWFMGSGARRTLTEYDSE